VEGLRQVDTGGRTPFQTFPPARGVAEAVSKPVARAPSDDFTRRCRGVAGRRRLSGDGWLGGRPLEERTGVGMRRADRRRGRVASRQELVPLGRLAPARRHNGGGSAQLGTIQPAATIRVRGRGNHRERDVAGECLHGTQQMDTQRGNVWGDQRRGDTGTRGEARRERCHSEKWVGQASDVSPQRSRRPYM